MNIEDYELLYIEPSRSDISNFRNIIKKQGDFTCKNLIDTLSISDAANGFTFGYVSLFMKAQLGRRSINSFSDKFFLKAFVLCNYSQLLPDELHIQLICSMNKTGKLLMEVVENKAREMNVKRLTLEALAIPKLRSWYESLGFQFVRDRFIDPKLPKLFYMVKYI